MTGAADGLGGLQLARAPGDLGALRQRGRPAIRIHLRDRAAGVSQLPGSARASTNGAAR
jgi:glucose-6-phosphate isomerase